MKKLFILSLFTILFQSPLLYSTPVDIKPVNEEVVVAKEEVKKEKGNFFSRLKEKMVNRRIKKALRKKKRKNFFSKLTDKVMERRIGKIAKKLGLGKYDCAKMVTTDGKEIDVKIVSVKDQVVKYQDCRSKDEAILTTSTDNVFIIRSKVGEEVKYTDIESLETKSKVRKKLARDKDKDKEGWGLGFLLGFVVGIVGVLIVMFAMDDDPRQKQILRGAWTGFAASILITLLIIIAYVVILASLAV